MIFEPDEYISIAQNFRTLYPSWEIVNMLKRGLRIIYVGSEVRNYRQLCLYPLSLDHQV